MNIKRLSVFVLFTVAVFAPAAFADGDKFLSCIIHLHSTYSFNETNTIAAIARDAHANNIDAVIMTDHDLMRWEYGIKPVRNLVKITRSKNSVLRSGPDRYLDEIARAAAAYPDMVFIPGVESSPFYYWSGSPWNRSLELRDWHKHLLVLGLDKPADYDGLPLVSNPKAGVFSPLKLWPLLTGLAAILLLRRKLRLIVAAASLLALINNYPFRILPFSPYSGPMGEKPYQNLIDYATSKGALVFWAHPEAPNWEKPENMGPVSIRTARYPGSVLNTGGHTGFALFPEGYVEGGKPGGYWDVALNQYCAGKRPRPVWAIGELDYGINSYPLDAIQNKLWTKEKNRKAVLEALAGGEFFIVWQDSKWGLALDDFSVASGGAVARCGGEIAYKSPVRLRLAFKCNDGKSRPAKTHIIRDGRLIATLDSLTPSRLAFEDPAILSPGLHYYRVIVDAGSSHYLAFNPVFVRKEQ